MIVPQPTAAVSTQARAHRRTWAALLARILDLDGTLCPSCSGKHVIEILSNVVDEQERASGYSGCFLLFTVDELNTFDNLRDELGTLESAPVFLGIGSQFEYHNERG